MKPFFITLIVFLLFFSCGKNKVDLSQIENLNGNKITPMGHAGMGIASQFPINTFESIRSALSLGTGGVEMDIQMTKDSVLILFHDKTLEEQTDLEGMIYEKNWTEINQAIYKNPPFAEYRILSLDQLFENIEDKKEFIFSLDFKLHESDHPENYILRHWNALIKVLDKHDMAENVFIESRRKPYLEKLQELRPDLKLFFLEEFEKGFEYTKERNYYGMIMPTTTVTAEQIKEAHAAGLRISLFGLLTKNENLDAIEKSPDFMQTDKVKYLVKVLK
ncbi:MAG: glycerophosphodiester phosphodiesterase [Saprospiraceae bacterium]